MFPSGLRHSFRDPQPLSYQRDFTEGDAGLGHTPGPGIHAHQHSAATRTRSPSLQILPMGFPGVTKWVVNVSDGRAEREKVDPPAQVSNDLDQGEFLIPGLSNLELPFELVPRAV